MLWLLHFLRKMDQWLNNCKLCHHFSFMCYITQRTNSLNEIMPSHYWGSYDTQEHKLQYGVV
uniref:Uncharacterized protein n=1 Tax=Anguilla anguilla TaxID=7936 RepID=A0A0E9W498_ANGAN